MSFPRQPKARALALSYSVGSLSLIATAQRKPPLLFWDAAVAPKSALGSAACCAAPLQESSHDGVHITERHNRILADAVWALMAAALDDGSAPPRRRARPMRRRNRLQQKVLFCVVFCGPSCVGCVQSSSRLVPKANLAVCGVGRPVHLVPGSGGTLSSGARKRLQHSPQVLARLVRLTKRGLLAEGQPLPRPESCYHCGLSSHGSNRQERNCHATHNTQRKRTCASPGPAPAPGTIVLSSPPLQARTQTTQAPPISTTFSYAMERYVSQHSCA